MNKTALITGINGQDASYLCELLLEKNYKVIGTLRRHSFQLLQNIKHLIHHPNLVLEYSDITDHGSTYQILNKYKPNEIYNLAAQSHVMVSFANPGLTHETNACAVLPFLEWISHNQRESRLYQASTSELYGDVLETPQTETTPFNPQSPYGVSKLSAYWSVLNYRQSYNIYACTGILFNHESYRRGNNFVTQKIVNGLKAVLEGKIEYLELGNLYAKRDWGHAKDYVKAMWLMLNQEKAKDYVISTDTQYCVKEFVDKACGFFNMSTKWVGDGLDEVLVDQTNNKDIIKINPNLFRPSEVASLIGCSDLARKELGWMPEISFEELIIEMCQNAKALSYTH